MCEICNLIIKRLVHKGLVSKGNVMMCQDEIVKELEIAAVQLSPEEIASMPHINPKDMN
jgi:hypothetical protein